MYIYHQFSTLVAELSLIKYKIGKSNRQKHFHILIYSDDIQRLQSL